MKAIRGKENATVARIQSIKTKRKDQYKIEDVRKALAGMVESKSARRMQELFGVPRSNLMRWFEQLTGRKASVKNRFNKREQQEFLIKAHQFRPPLSQSRRYFTDDEEEMFVIMLEEAHNAAFPYDRDALKSLATSSGKKIYGKDFQVGNTWVRCFENRWKERLAKVKCGSIDRSRGKKATAEVRDAVYDKFEKFLQQLIDEGNMTEQQAANLGDHLANADEVGGDERGQSKKKVYKGRKRNAAWRSTDLGGDHNPFHVTLMLVSLSFGILADSVFLIHSSPGVSKPRMCARLYEYIPAQWSVRRTETGSMTRDLFEDWVAFFIRSMDKTGYGRKHDNPLILLLDGHTSRWTYEGLKALIDAGIYPFFIASHTSAWHQPNDCGLNALYKSKFNAAVRRWRLANPYSVFDRVCFNKCCYEAVMSMQFELTADLAKWRAVHEAWQQAGSPPQLKPKGKAGNKITRMYERTGWWPLKRDSEEWRKAINTLGVLCKPTKKHKLHDKVLMADLGDKSIRIRKLVLDAFQDSFLDKAYAVEEAVKAKARRRQESISIINTALGKGLTAVEDLELLREAKERKAAEKRAKELRSQAALQRREIRKQQIAIDLHDARAILFRCKNNQHRATKDLSCKHYRALLGAMGRAKQASGLKKVDLVRLYWAKHEDITTHPGTRPTPIVVTAVQAAPTTARDKSRKWGPEKAREDAEGGEYVSSSDSESVSSWNSTMADGDPDESRYFSGDDEGGDVFMNDKDWSLFVRCEVEEASGEWRGVDVYCLKENPANVCMHFGGEEYEGLPGGTYRFDRSESHLYDADGEIIEIRNVVYV